MICGSVFDVISVCVFDGIGLSVFDVMLSFVFGVVCGSAFEVKSGCVLFVICESRIDICLSFSVEEESVSSSSSLSFMNHVTALCVLKDRFSLNGCASSPVLG